MRYGDQKLLLEFAKLMLRISAAKNPHAQVDITEDTVSRSGGYKRLRHFFMHISPPKRARMRRYLRQQVDGVKALMAKAEASGEEFTLADIEIDLRDAESGDKFPDAPNVALETAEDAAEPENDNKEQST